MGGALWTIPKHPAIENASWGKYVMVVGIDASHDTQNRKNSVLAWVSSVDPNFVRYWSKVKVG